MQDKDGKQVTVRSKLETQFVDILKDFDIPWEYEGTKLNYYIPESKHTYLIDFSIQNKLHLELKGYLSDHAERTKYILVKEQHPDLDIRFVFANCHKPCGGMKMTHGEWATKHGFKYCSIRDYETIKEWINENISNT